MWCFFRIKKGLRRVKQSLKKIENLPVPYRRSPIHKGGSTWLRKGRRDGCPVRRRGKVVSGGRGETFGEVFQKCAQQKDRYTNDQKSVSLGLIIRSFEKIARENREKILQNPPVFFHGCVKGAGKESDSASGEEVHKMWLDQNKMDGLGGRVGEIAENMG